MNCLEPANMSLNKETENMNANTKKVADAQVPNECVVMPEYTQGICSDGAAILRNGKQLTIEEILQGLRQGEISTKRAHSANKALIRINDVCWEAIGRNHMEIDRTFVLNILEDQEKELEAIRKA